MTAPTRLLDSDDRADTHPLLQAGLGDAPSPHSARRTAIALGLSASGVAIATSGSAAAAASAGVGVVAAPTASASLLVLAGQWFAAGVLGGLTLAGGASWLATPAPDTATSPAPQAIASTQNTQRDRQAVPRFSELESAEARAPRPVLSADPPPSRAANGASFAARERLPIRALEASPSDGSLAREVAQIDAARRALASGDAQAALSALDEYARLDRTRTLDREAQILRIDALVALNQRASALALARAYLRQHASDPHAPKLRALLNETVRAAP